MPERGVLAVWTVLVYMVQFTLVLDRYQSVTSALQLMAGRTALSHFLPGFVNGVKCRALIGW